MEYNTLSGFYYIYTTKFGQLGQWLNVNGESIYSSKPWSHQNDTMTRNIWYILENLKYESNYVG
jgi:alpha-L-fucosidase